MSDIQQTLDDMSRVSSYLGQVSFAQAEVEMCELETNGWSCVITAAMCGFEFNASHETLGRVSAKQRGISNAVTIGARECRDRQRKWAQSPNGDEAF